MAAAAPAVAAAPRHDPAAGRGRAVRVAAPSAGASGSVWTATSVRSPSSRRRLADAARALGLPVEDRPFRAHLTVGRWRPRQPADGALPELLADYRGPEWPVTEVRLLESHLGPDPRYEPLAAWPVG